MRTERITPQLSPFGYFVRGGLWALLFWAVSGVLLAASATWLGEHNPLWPIFNWLFWGPGVMTVMPFAPEYTHDFFWILPVLIMNPILYFVIGGLLWLVLRRIRRAPV